VAVSAFRPARGTAGGHRQTLLGYWYRRRLRWDAPAEDLIVEAGDDVRLLARVSWQDGARAARPAVVIVHGLGGCDAAGYVVSTARLARARGWHVARMNMRGAGDGEALCPRLYNAGLDGDLLAVLAAMARHTPTLAVVGFSLGANLALLALARGGDRVPAGLAAAVAVSPPLDLAACADALARPALVLAAHDDPMVPGESVARWPLPASGLVQREMTATGGHVGFVAPTGAPGRFWAAERALAFLTGALNGKAEGMDD
jgi:predicted alpha/beta-fold hydrolase